MENEILALPAECWRWVPSYEGLYQVSTRGRVRSVDRWVTYPDGSKRFIKGRILKPGRNKNGYLQVNLCRDGKGRKFLVHRLVAMAWIDNPEGKPEVNHLDENPSNPDVFNLSFCSRKENVRWGTGIKRGHDSLSKPVQALDVKTGEVVLEFPSAKEAQRNGFNSTSISLCCRGIRLKTHKGYCWRYKDDYDQENTWTPVKIGGKANPVQALDVKTGEVVLEFPSAREAERNGFKHGAICACCLGKKRYKTHKGYIWRFKP